MTAAETRAWTALAVTTTLLGTELERQSQRDGGMPHAYYALLVALYEAPDRSLRMSALAQARRISRSRLTHAVTSMERSGWVARSATEGDGRGQTVALTRAGIDHVREFAPMQVAELRKPVLTGLDDAELVQLAALLDRVVANVETLPR